VKNSKGQGDFRPYRERGYVSHLSFLFYSSDVSTAPEGTFLVVRARISLSILKSPSKLKMQKTCTYNLVMLSVSV
jgi:hypothetical protein